MTVAAKERPCSWAGRVQGLVPRSGSYTRQLCSTQKKKKKIHFHICKTMGALKESLHLVYLHIPNITLMVSFTHLELSSIGSVKP